MKATLKRLEFLATQHAKRFANGWDYFAIATGAYLAGYVNGKHDTNNGIDSEAIQEYEITDGTHQLSAVTFEKWKLENDSLSFKELLTKTLPQYDFKEIRVAEDERGVISFQGVGKKK